MDPRKDADRPNQPYQYDEMPEYLKSISTSLAFGTFRVDAFYEAILFSILFLFLACAMSTYDLLTGLPGGLVSFGPHANCTLELCPIEASLLGYRPSIPASGTFIAIFSLLLVIHVILGCWLRTFGFALSIICGCALEVAGYGGRVVLHDNPFSFNGFIAQIVCITVAPLFYCAAIYVLLSQVIIEVDASLSRLKPTLLYWIFITCDVISLILQAAGGALSCVAAKKSEVQVGVDISLAGLIFQVICVTSFCGFFVDYWRLCRKHGVKAAASGKMKTFLIFLFLSIALILLRCVYRIVELREGYFSEMFRDEPLFIALESSVIATAVVCLTIGHPGFALSPKKQRNKN